MHTNLHLFGQLIVLQNSVCRYLHGKSTPHAPKRSRRACRINANVSWLAWQYHRWTIKRCFGAIHFDITVAVNATHPDSTMFIETTALKHAHSGIGTTDHWQERNWGKRFARKYFLRHKAQYCDAEMIVTSYIIEDMPTIESVIHLARTIAVAYLPPSVNRHSAPWNASWRHIACQCYTMQKSISNCDSFRTTIS